MIKRTQQKGFSLIEMIVSLGVFSLVVTMAVGALLMMIAANRQLQAEQSVMSNLAFALDSMTREIRTGYAYYCGSVVNKNAPVQGGSTRIFDDEGSGKDDHDGLDQNDVRDCGSKSDFRFRGVSFIESGNSITGATSNRILYFYDSDEKKLFRRVGNGTAQSIVSSGLEIVDAQFFVTGSESLRASGSDTEQPTVTIYIEAKDKEVGYDKVYKLQTTVTQRTLDI